MEWTADTPMRLDAFLAKQMHDLSRVKVQKLIKDGSINVNDTVIRKSSFHLDAGDVVHCASIETSRREASTETRTISQANLHLPVLYEDDDCLVINKPAGYAVHTGHSSQPDETTILHGIAFLFDERSIPFSPDAVLVHRLDKDTTGCLLIAKRSEVHQKLQQQFEDRTVRKQYLAFVSGVPDPPEAVIDAPIGRNLTDRTKMSIVKTSVSREARTTYTTLDAVDRCALLLCDLHTGRTHQIRVHLRSIGHPILGDASYGTSASEKLSREFAIEGLCLHAWKLTFQSTVDGQVHTIVASIPETFATHLIALDLHAPPLQQ